MNYRIFSAVLFLTPFQADAQASPEHHVWQESKSFAALSETSVAITGAIKLSGNDKFSIPGTKMQITFSTGATVKLSSVVAAWRNWELGSQEKQTGEVFILSNDPGQLTNGNTLCGGSDPGKGLYVVFVENSILGMPPTLDMAVFQSEKPPFDINSAGLCGTYSYVIDAPS